MFQRWKEKWMADGRIAPQETDSNELAKSKVAQY
jgi:hypothetical protein